MKKTLTLYSLAFLISAVIISCLRLDPWQNTTNTDSGGEQFRLSDHYEFEDHMNIEIIKGSFFISGHSLPRDEITMNFNGKTRNTQSLDDGSWKFKFDDDLLGGPSDLNARDPRYDLYNALECAAYYLSSIEVIELLVSLGADFSQSPGVLFKAIEHWTVDRDDPNTAYYKALIEAGADINAVDEETGDSILYTASAWPNWDVVKLLLDYGADPDSRGGYYQMRNPAIMYPILYNNFEIQ